MNYQKQAEDFLKKANATIKIELAKNQLPSLWHKDGQDYGLMYNVTIERENKKPFSFNFWDSIANKEKMESLETANMFIGNDGRKHFSGELGFINAKRELKSKIDAGEFKPTAYDILACLTKYDPGFFEDFCSEYGYDEDSRTAERTFLAVIKEWKETSRMFGDLLEELQEIN